MVKRIEKLGRFNLHVKEIARKKKETKNTQLMHFVGFSTPLTRDDL